MSTTPAAAFALLLTAVLAGGPLHAEELTAAQVEKALAAADAAVAEAAEKRVLWLIPDPAAGQNGAVAVDELLEIARQQYQQGQLAEALRIAQKVEFMAEAGIEQYRRNQQLLQ